jgi:hypothetical protein
MMSDNVLQTLQQLVQDVIAPDVRELKVRIGAVEKQLESLERHMDLRFTSSDQKSDAQFKALMAAISESRAQSELTMVRMVAALSERVAVLEAKRQ